MFEVLKTEGRARRGEFTCPHGTVQTPVFMNVGTQGGDQRCIERSGFGKDRHTGGTVQHLSSSSAAR